VNSLDGDFDDDEMTDCDLDIILARARANIITHVRMATNPAGALVAIMAACGEEEPTSQIVGQESGPKPPNSPHLAPRRLAALLEVRRCAAEVDQRFRQIVSLARDLAEDLDRELTEHADLPIAIGSACALAQHQDRRLVQLLSRTRDLVVQIELDLRRVRELDRDLTVDKDTEVIRELSSDVPLDKVFDELRALDYHYADRRRVELEAQINEAHHLGVSLEEARRLADLRQRWKRIDRSNAREVACALDRALDRAGELVGELLFRVDALEVDANYADLSDVTINQLDFLTGVFWNDGTVWPPEVAEHIEDVSFFVTDEVRQVRPSGRRPAVSLGRHAAEQLPSLSRLLPECGA
jgi:hypothetical protein